MHNRSRAASAGWRLCLAAVIALGAQLAPRPAAAGTSAEIRLTPLLPSGQPAGTTVAWTAGAGGRRGEAARYRFSVALDSGGWRVARDFSPDNFFLWTPLVEGSYQVQVTVQDIETGEMRAATAPYLIRSRLSGLRPEVAATSHPLVLLFSAPPCPAGRVRVRFHALPGGAWQATPWQPCRPDMSLNVYVAGLRAVTLYELQAEVETNAGLERGPLVWRRTGAIDAELPGFTVLDRAGPRASRQDAVLLQSVNGGVYEKVLPVATDLSGQVIWYYRFREIENPRFPWHIGQYLLRPAPGGTFLLFLNYRGGFDQVLREIDLAGNPVRETNVEQVNRQLAALGQDPIGYFHHDALRLDNGHTLVIGSVERLLTDVQGPGVVDVLGDMLIDLDENFQVAWAWNAFEHLDVTRAAVLGERCTVVTVGCPPISLALSANDWTHANAVVYSPADGSLLLSLRNQDWIVKLDYRDGAGDGAVLWRLGPGGDFSLNAPGAGPFPWFSHQHDPVLDGRQLALLDNGNTRCEPAPLGCNSRGQVLELDEAARTATLVLDADLGRFATAFGSAQRLSNGNYHFLAGILLPGVVSRSVEVTPAGEQVFSLQTEGTQYRSYRMRDLYTPVTPAFLQSEPGQATGPEALYLPFVVR